MKATWTKAFAGVTPLEVCHLYRRAAGPCATQKVVAEGFFSKFKYRPFPDRAVAKAGNGLLQVNWN